MRSHYFDSHLLVSNRNNKSGIPRLRISIPIRSYEFICNNGEVKFLRGMHVTRANGQVVFMKYPRISKGSKQGNYVPHYITISAKDVQTYGFQPKESVHVVVEWDE